MSRRKNKRQRLSIKREKRLIKLMYRKGLLNDYPLDTLQWFDDRIYPFIGRWFDCDYGGYHWPIASDIITELRYDHIPESLPDGFDYQNDDMLKFTTFHCETYSILIKNLKGLPTLRSDSKINKILIVRRT